MKIIGKICDMELFFTGKVYRIKEKRDIASNECMWSQS